MASSISKSLVKTFFKLKGSNNVHTTQTRWSSITCQVEKLESRGLLRVSGSDAISFLQGIVTNDIRHLEQHCQSLYTMFLNTKGRVLYDSIIYKTKQEDTFFLECDKEAMLDLEKHLKMYKLRKKVAIDSVDDEFQLWALFNPSAVVTPGSDVINIKQEVVVPCSTPSYENTTVDKYLSNIAISNQSLVYVDPRLSKLGTRVISPRNEDVVERLRVSGIDKKNSDFTYRMFRYKLGVGEGIYELPTGKCFPLEANCDYLHGVSFHKGCYIGQELTARTHHTGVVRKRLMPLVLKTQVESAEIPLDAPIEPVTGEKKPAIGKLRGLERDCAIGLMRITEALETIKFKIGNIEGETFRPFWWPQELPKDRVDLGSGKRS
ncbi:putative transferase CAF17 homolog, mitochondrial [Macrosteles quadrilineatus]|uniref:putative transferase CAF17 homolog, mitochondrial n=1 Tax=Macrosteles quadrilineatus TaxID=74068 RepID=UPI0023E15AA2|nr:putative transferase CAF17 homolog, mitochondrial [Macrosteles quadrilineatus]